MSFSLGNITRYKIFVNIMAEDNERRFLPEVQYSHPPLLPALLVVFGQFSTRLSNTSIHNRNI